MSLFHAFKALAQGCVVAARDFRELPNAFLQKDPAARSKAEVILLYPGFRAVVAARFAHELWKQGNSFSARAICEVSRVLTGIEIHPGAQLGRRVVIDHGMGIVVGETAIIEDDVVIYQGVTLGGTLLIKEKRHPTIRTGSVIGVGACVLGDIEVGPEARVGAGAVVVKAVAPGTSVGGIPAVVLNSRHLRSIKSKE